MPRAMDEPERKEGGDAAEERISRAILGALRERSGSLDGASGSPAGDPRLSERILAEARVRSARIAGGGTSARLQPAGRPIPAWLWLAWVVALAAAASAWWALG